MRDFNKVDFSATKTAGCPIKLQGSCLAPTKHLGEGGLSAITDTAGIHSQLDESSHQTGEFLF